MDPNVPGRSAEAVIRVASGPARSNRLSLSLLIENAIGAAGPSIGPLLGQYAEFHGDPGMES